MGTDRDRELLDAAELFRLQARTPEEEAYFQGYASGVSERLAGGTEQDTKDPSAFERRLGAADSRTRARMAGYRDGLTEVPLIRRSDRV